jgi:hypothetical protein
MKRYARVLLVLTGLLAVGTVARADGWHSLHYGGYQPWWNIFAHRTQMSCEEERLQRFWHDYYDSLKRYYGSLDRIDWVAYYKNHGYQINTGCGGYGGGACGGSGRIQFAPVFVSPSMQWAVPNSCLSGAPTGAPCPPIGAFGGPTMGGPAIGMGGMPMPPAMGPQMGMAYPH